MKKKQSSFPLWAIALILALVIGGYYVFRSNLQSGQVAQISVDPGTETNTLVSSPLNSETKSNGQTWTPSGIKVTYDLNMLKGRIPKQASFCLTRKTAEFTYDKTRYYAFTIAGGLTDGKGIIKSAEPPVKIKTRKWIGYIKGNNDKILATSSVDINVWSNTVNPQDVSQIEFMPPVTIPSSTPSQKVASLVLCLDKNTTDQVDANVSLIEVSTRPLNYVPPAEQVQ